METYLPAFVTVISTVVLAIIGWAFHTQARVSVLEARTEATKDQIKSKDEDIKELIKVHFDGVNKRLDRIEHSMTGHQVKD